MILKGDCIEVMKAMKPNSVDAIVTDPPYGLEFMGKDWDKLRNTWQAKKGRYHNDTTFIAKGDRIRYQAGLEMQLWHTQWLTEAYRVLKPGGSMLVMGGTRTSHRLACAIEDSGFIIKDTLMWLYGSGFPKAQELSTLMDAKTLGISMKEVKKRREVVGKQKPFGRENRKKMMNGSPFNTSYEDKDCEYNITKPLSPEGEYWNGFKVGGIKPAYEPIIWAVKPPEGSYIDNVLKWGVGAVNVDECRVGVDEIRNQQKDFSPIHGNKFGDGSYLPNKDEIKISKGRFPANIILSHHPECVQVGVKRVKQAWSDKGILSVDGFNPGRPYKEKPGRKVKKHCDSDGYETVESWDCHPGCAVRMLDEQSGNLKSGKDNIRRKEGFFIEHGKLGKAGDVQVSYGDNGGASRFYYCAKASRAERNAGLERMEESKFKEHDNPARVFNERDGGKGDEEAYKPQSNNHPTVKPIKLFEWLIKLVTREGQVILDPFIGSGTTAIAAHNTERKFMGIEKEEEYIEIAKRRAEHWRSRPRQLKMTGG